jgi:hypothetical protein
MPSRNSEEICFENENTHIDGSVNWIANELTNALVNVVLIVDTTHCEISKSYNKGIDLFICPCDKVSEIIVIPNALKPSLTKGN